MVVWWYWLIYLSFGIKALEIPCSNDSHKYTMRPEIPICESSPVIVSGKQETMLRMTVPNKTDADFVNNKMIDEQTNTTENKVKGKAYEEECKVCLILLIALGFGFLWKISNKHIYRKQLMMLHLPQTITEQCQRLRRDQETSVRQSPHSDESYNSIDLDMESVESLDVNSLLSESDEYP